MQGKEGLFIYTSFGVGLVIGDPVIGTGWGEPCLIQ